jgi:hypothetical protein
MEWNNAEVAEQAGAQHSGCEFSKRSKERQT